MDKNPGIAQRTETQPGNNNNKKRRGTRRGLSSAVPPSLSPTSAGVSGRERERACWQVCFDLRGLTMSSVTWFG